jgi:hypothetical protein
MIETYATSITEQAATYFQAIAENMRSWKQNPERASYFLTRLAFCLVAEKLDLLPQGILSEIIEQTRAEPARFSHYAQDLFRAMADGGELLYRKIPWFNGALFDEVAVEELSYEALSQLQQAAALNWASIEPAIFGTLFERSLDPAKRAQLGAHYTKREDILLILEPVLMQPLRREWRALQAQAGPLLKARQAGGLSTRQQHELDQELGALRAQMLRRIQQTTVLDPACGSGNFLYVALHLLLDMEKEVLHSSLWQHLERPRPQVHPRQLFGMEIDPIAHALASIVVWIGYIQWQQNNGYFVQQEPILENLSGNILLKDAILATDDTGQALEPDWQATEVITGNPPFLGNKRMRAELGDSYTEKLRTLYEQRVPGGADLVCYWFERAREQIKQGKNKRAGFLATNSIRSGANRKVLDRIKADGDIFMAWSDRPWVLAGAHVRISVVGFDDGAEQERVLDGAPVTYINADLQNTIDATKARPLPENKGLAFQGPVKVGDFDIQGDLARQFLASPNASGRDNAEVIKPYINGDDIAQGLRDVWLIDFGLMSESEAARYEAPFRHVETYVKPYREKNRDAQRRKNWWRLGRSGEEYRKAKAGLSRQLFTPQVSKHRLFEWYPVDYMPALIIAFARDDDYFFGVLHSRFHERWSLRLGSWLGAGNDPRYTPTTTLETFPFPWAPGQEETASPDYQAISAAAQALHAERAAWLNTPGLSSKAREERTLTHLYNALDVYRGRQQMRVKTAAGEFAPHLDELHRALDAAVCRAYGWELDLLEEEERMLRHLMALNVARLSD